ncbi:NAD(P)/FAD-dependent oxidoreductase [Streptomyces sp. R302]|uniref:flavin-containing monooxygenase n=1 Tax=unclassified Streptomyces TaxID=2593676 RepID=UPI00145D1E37|nr:MULTISPECIES: NAD(P)/FAD-dependent oxidoreductase [unclassified Streptomyces]NML52716.1 NAD(P)/FAD-dependent oxidoreductase [Streptomyces sp. R301]NML80355.1 NAD(P)/FAD-dependent oxidoreductase [Streptomyces sp. R302]
MSDTAAETAGRVTGGTGPAAVEHLDVLVVGAGVSGIGIACHLRRELPGKSFAILEARASLGGTWDLFRYPGIRSDSDLHTFGYAFKPWRDRQAIADGSRIRDYLRETATEHGLDGAIRHHHRVRAASWSGERARWTVEVERADTGESTTLTCGWLVAAGGYYRYDEGYTPAFEGRERFRGTVAHPQHWPDGLDHAGQRVVVIGSGATAVTLVPALAGTAAHVTMVQRTPTYVLPVNRDDALAGVLRRCLGERRAHALIRRKNVLLQSAFFRFCRRCPKAARRLIRRLNARLLPPGYPVDEHFNPPYEPWDQRLCTAPDGDLFTAVREGRATVVTDRITGFTETGVELASGRHVDADVVVTATGLNVRLLDGISLTVDGAPVRLADTVVFKGLMLSGVPNLALAIGYTHASWTLKIDLVGEHLCRLLRHMDAHGLAVCRPEPADPAMPTRPLLDLGAGYVRRAVDELPRQGDRGPWRTPVDYRADVRLLRDGDVSDPELHFG